MAKTLIEGAIAPDADISFTVYCNNHVPSFSSDKEHKSSQLEVIREATPLLMRSQPLNLYYKNLKRLLIEHDVIHHHYPFPTMERALIKNLDILQGKKLIITWHANIQNSRWSWTEKFYNPMVTKMLDVADCIVVTSPQLFEQSSILQNYKQKVRVIPLTFDPRFASHTPKVLENRNRRILFVGKLREYKGLKYLIEAMQTIDADLDIVGNGEKEKELRALTAALSLTNKIKFHTQATDEDLKVFYQNTDLFVLPSINEAEAFGVVQLEALSSGTPVINTRLKSGVPYVSLNGVSGITVRPESSSEISSAIKDIFTDAERYKAYSRNALARAAEFTVDKMVDKYLETYS